MDYTILVSTCHFCLSSNFKLVLTLFLLFHIFQHLCLGKVSLMKELFRSEQLWHATVNQVTFLNCTEDPRVNRVQLFFLPQTE